jgi:TonB family protein
MLRLILISVFVLFLSACSQEQSALSEFKNSNEAAEMNKCVGARGNIDWSIFKTESTSNPDVRIIQAEMTKGDEKFTRQWIYNIKTNVSEFAYAGKTDKQSNLLITALDFSLFCMRSGVKDKEQSNSNQTSIDKPKNIDSLRREIQKRIDGLSASDDSDSSTGKSLKSLGPSESYAGRIRARIKPNIVFSDDPSINNPAEIEVRTTTDGTILNRKIIKPSGNTAWDNAVLKAIDKTEVLPRDIDGRAYSPLVISFKPTE